ncbi:MAG: hypothetical protein U9Q74_08990, partial [Gemmatimonadota bacterium]|nr:hypothetical protein [Gemmatimonadota bacterium]
MPRKKQITKWEGRLGVWPLVVWYGERPEKGHVCYTRTWSTQTENWRWKSCRTKVRRPDGSLDPDAQARVIEMAKRRHDLLTGRVTETPVDALPPVRIVDTWAIMTGEGGRYPTRTTYRDELEAGLHHAAKVLGGDFAWLHMDEEAFTRVIRAKVKEARARRLKDGSPRGWNGFRAGVQAG